MSGSSDYPVESGIPIPRGREPYDSYPFGQMTVGDSFLVPVDKSDNWRSIHERVRAASSKYGIDHAMKFTVRRVAEGLRVWRTK